jgi:hypothetical protein
MADHRLENLIQRTLGAHSNKDRKEQSKVRRNLQKMVNHLRQNKLIGHNGPHEVVDGDVWGKAVQQFNLNGEE